MDLPPAEAIPTRDYRDSEFTVPLPEELLNSYCSIMNRWTQIGHQVCQPIFLVKTIGSKLLIHKKDIQCFALTVKII